MRVKGRYFVLAWTAVFLAAVAVIVLRDGAAFPARHHLDDLEARIRALEGIRADLKAKISGLESSDSLWPKAAALGLRFATDSELKNLSVPGRP
jgi:cell division protein FtsL